MIDQACSLCGFGRFLLTLNLTQTIHPNQQKSTSPFGSQVFTLIGLKKNAKYLLKIEVSNYAIFSLVSLLLFE